ncbi:PREDICTED: ABSCISIC ACID-INSENSITIVE 5-like protein 4 [Camelina sativa]|uniref:ABSCISIC ACID-INSENSITIVE 5-like protein 4 n=1 Tax=Camelina sativa TaxID=90675 RepID=A0ABM0VVU1_CAMSA|nr:PREDICTED: ABSCISIC ACID-INSENSITIVE 5-like protein 4 [Camelina sativa]XP_010461820.1 PREDICTED: ABSCISIC ACID-INSENSITIVE 5-like protein 4 [Camelina sativa]XP_019091727.1 PREDICTED: ABSCISIC ACID-INSENSITIVE 5-like protein 4 [Camelina sativa]
MGTHIDFDNLGVDSSGGNGCSTYQSKPLARQSSLYSLTFDELQSTLGEPGKDFGSMNMDELLKNIWTAEEAQAFMTTTPSSVAASGPSGFVPGGNVLQRQGSLTLPRTLSQKTVDEVWKHLNSKDGSNGNSRTDVPPERQQTLGEMTLEDFLLRAGVVKEDTNSTQQNDNSSGFYANNGAAGLGFGFGQPNQNSIPFNGNNDSMIYNQAPGSALKVGGKMQQQQKPHQQQQHPYQRLPPTIFPKQANVAFAPVNLVNRGLFDAGLDGPVNSNMGGAGVTVAATSPGTSSAENNTWSSPVPYVFGRGRRSNTGLEKVVERRQKRMIKNRESAARSRARKQAYTLELEAEIESLKQLNQDLQKKQAEIMKTQNSEVKELSKLLPCLAKTQCLRRTLTGPW